MEYNKMILNSLKSWNKKQLLVYFSCYSKPFKDYYHSVEIHGSVNQAMVSSCLFSYIFLRIKSVSICKVLEFYLEQSALFKQFLDLSTNKIYSFMAEEKENPMATQDQKTAKFAKCFVLNCMDFRLIDDSVYFMDSLGYNNNYDAFVVAGSSLGFTQEKYPHWGQTVLDHMTLGQKFHKFEQIIMIDHIQCGAYKTFYPNIKSEEEQVDLHKKHMQMAKDKFLKMFPKYPFRGFLMDLQGKCVQIELK